MDVIAAQKAHRVHGEDAAEEREVGPPAHPDLAVDLRQQVGEREIEEGAR